MVVSTSRHVASPAFDLRSEKWEDATGTLSGELDTVPGEEVELRLYVPEGWRVASAPGGELVIEGHFVRVRWRPASALLVWSVSFCKKGEN
jgi:hypothetical protein